MKGKITMSNTELSRYAGWSAIVSAITTVLGLVTLLIFFAQGEPWGTLNDITSVILALSLLPVLLMLYRLHRRDAPRMSLVTLMLGVIGLLAAAVVQSLLIIKVITYAQTAILAPSAFGLFGISLMVFGFLGRTNPSLPQRLILLSIIAGAGYVLVIAGFILGGQEHPLAAIGGLIAVIGYPIWAMWFGQLVLSGKLTTQSTG
jgi:hypothetical protein